MSNNDKVLYPLGISPNPGKVFKRLSQAKAKWIEDKGWQVPGNIDLLNLNLKILPTFCEVGRDFYCYNNSLTSLQGAPKEVGRDFYCSHNSLTSLQGAPKKVEGSFYCFHNSLTSLQGAPEKVGGDFYCSGNKVPLNYQEYLRELEKSKK